MKNSESQSSELETLIQKAQGRTQKSSFNHHPRRLMEGKKICQCFSNFNVHWNYLGILLKCRFWISRSRGKEGRLRVHIANEFLDYVYNAIPWTASWIARGLKQSGKSLSIFSVGPTQFLYHVSDATGVVLVQFHYFQFASWSQADGSIS